MFFFNDTATTEIYTLSLHDALPICPSCSAAHLGAGHIRHERNTTRPPGRRHLLQVWNFRLGYPGLDSACELSNRTEDRKSTRLNSSHANISYAVFCLKKKNTPIAER